METIRDVLCFLNDFDFTGILEKIRLLKKRLVTEIDNYNVSKMIYARTVVDERYILSVTNILDSRLEITDSVIACIFC